MKVEQDMIDALNKTTLAGLDERLKKDIIRLMNSTNNDSIINVIEQALCHAFTEYMNDYNEERQ